MEVIVFQKVVEEIRAKDARYHPAAYICVHEALACTQGALAKARGREVYQVTVQELLEGLREWGLALFGPMTPMVFEHWGVHTCRDLGEIVFNLVESGLLPG